MMSGEGLNSTRPPSPRSTMRPHLRVARMAVARGVIRGTVDGAFHSATAGEFADLRHVVRPRRQRFVAHAQAARQSDSLRDHIDADDFPRAELPAKRPGRQTYRAEAGDQDGFVATYADLLQAFVHSAEAAGYLRAVRVSQLGGEVKQVLLLRQQIVGHAAVALPPVGAAVLFAGARDHVAAPAVVA